MGRITRLDELPPSGLLKLPFQLLIKVVSPLSIRDIRQLGRVNRQLCVFADDYLLRNEYKSKYFELPNEILHDIVKCLDSQKDLSHLAQATQKLYAVYMDIIIHHDVEHDGSSILACAAKNNLASMTRKLLSIGGDINTRREYVSGQASDRGLTPLAIAASYGSEEVVGILFQGGATQSISGVRVALVNAIFGRHESVALILSQEVESTEMLLGPTRGTVLEMARAAQLPLLVRYFVEKQPAPRVRARRAVPKASRWVRMGQGVLALGVVCVLWSFWGRFL
jgi:ankyrin repeat protein